MAFQGVYLEPAGEALEDFAGSDMALLQTVSGKQTF
jgi:hypothetical protein